MVNRGAAVIACLWFGAAATHAVQLPLDARAIDEAIAIGHSRVEQQRIRFHAPYRVMVSMPPLDFVDIITPFRRIVLEAENRTRAGGRTFTQREALAALEGQEERIELRLELTFHPLHTLVQIPEFEVTLLPAAGAPIEPQTLQRIQQHGQRVEGALLPDPLEPPLGTDLPLTGATIMAGFDGGTLAEGGAYTLVLSEAGVEIARVLLDPGKLR